MMNLHRRSRLGFTLIELAIVLSVIGLMSVGIWRLLSSGNQQIKDTATAGQQIQLVKAVKSFLASSDGQTFLEAQCSPNCATGLKVTLPLPGASTAAGAIVCYSPIAGDANLNTAGMNVASASGTPAQAW